MKAEERFVHGLLELAAEPVESREARIERVLESLDAPPRRRLSRTVVSIAATVAVVLCVVTVLSRGESLHAVVQEAIAATLDLGPRRYAVKVMLREGSDPALTGFLETIDPSHVVLRVFTPRGNEISFGRDPQSTWTARRYLSSDPDLGNGGVARYYVECEQCWPCWLSLEKALVLVEPELLQRMLREDYDLRRNGEQTLGGLTLERVTATHDQPPRNLPNVIDLWIEPNTRLVRRMELCFPEDENLPDDDAFLDRPSFSFQDPLQPASCPQSPASNYPPSSLRPHSMTFELLERPQFTTVWFSPNPNAR